VYYKKGLDTLAVKSFEETVRKDPANPGYQFHLGLAYLKTGDKAKAKTALQKALSSPGSFAGADEAKKLLAGLE
jgi:Tfp pilus assembly protein PilF